MAYEGAAPEVVSVEMPAEVPKSQKSARLRPMPTREGRKTKKDKQNMMQLVHKSLRKH